MNQPRRCCAGCTSEPILNRRTREEVPHAVHEYGGQHTNDERCPSIAARKCRHARRSCKEHTRPSLKSHRTISAGRRAICPHDGPVRVLGVRQSHSVLSVFLLVLSAAGSAVVTFGAPGDRIVGERGGSVRQRMARRGPSSVRTFYFIAML